MTSHCNSNTTTDVKLEMRLQYDLCRTSYFRITLYVKIRDVYKKLDIQILKNDLDTAILSKKKNILKISELS